MEEGVAGPAVKMTKGHQCMAENNILNIKQKNPKKPNFWSVQTNFAVPPREDLADTHLDSPPSPEQQGLTVGM